MQTPGPERPVAPVSRVVVRLQNGGCYATRWGRVDAHLPPGTSDEDLLTGRVLARTMKKNTVLAIDDIVTVSREFRATPPDEGQGAPPQIILEQDLTLRTPRGRKIIASTARYMRDRLGGVSGAQIDHVLDNPVTSWAERNNRTAYSDGRLVVTMGSPEFDDECVLAVSHAAAAGERPRDDSSNPAQDKRRVSGQKADRRRPIPTTVGDFLERLREYGFEVEDGRRHYNITHPQRPGLSTPVPRTPSDHRWAANQVAQTKQVFDIDIREPL